MDVRVAGHQVDTGELLREQAQRRMTDITEKYFARGVSANVTFGRGPNNDFTCDIVAPVVQGVVLKASSPGARGASRAKRCRRADRTAVAALRKAPARA